MKKHLYKLSFALFAVAVLAVQSCKKDPPALLSKQVSEFKSNPRPFSSFYDMAEENAVSRIYLGVHFRMDCDAGVDLGYRCGRKVNEIDFK